jgi:hypothetical protein
MAIVKETAGLRETRELRHYKEECGIAVFATEIFANTG